MRKAVVEAIETLYRLLFCEGLRSQLSQGILGLVGDRCGEGLADFALDARHAFDATKTVYDSGTTQGRICPADFACCLEFPVHRPQISQTPIQISIHILVLELGGQGRGPQALRPLVLGLLPSQLHFSCHDFPQPA